LERALFTHHFFIKRNAGKTAYFLLLYHEETEKSIDFDSLSQLFLYKFAVAFLANIDKSTGRNRSVRCFCGMFFLNMFLLAAVTVHDQTRIETVQA